MGMIDNYEPSDQQCCPVCQTALSRWQGKEGPCLLFVWRQDFAAPVDQPIVEECQMPVEERERERLPAEFSIYSHDCPCPYVVEAECRTEAGVWVRTELVTAETAVQGKYETRRDFHSRLRWLQGRYHKQPNNAL